MVLRLKPMGKLVTSEAEVLDRTKVLHGPRTQTYGESSHSKRPKCKVLGLKSMGKLVTPEA